MGCLAKGAATFVATWRTPGTVLSGALSAAAGRGVLKWVAGRPGPR
ncbi:hypothetical protein ABOZ73_13120 [Caulobacter sp. 73W]|uniref:Uncharacterized protein n=1 Tax=Caulobacter sp. 73W TaxID=3161137 RepID=A0AB39KXK1_9CAUL